MAKEKYKYEKIYQGKGEFKRIYQLDGSGKKREMYGHNNHGKQYFKFILRKVKPTSVVDIGCGYNEFCEMLKEKGIESVGVDFACPGADIMASAENLPFRDGQFDLLTAFDVLEHIPEEEIDTSLKEFERIAHRFMYKICLRKDFKKIDGETLHPTVRFPEWWIDKITKNGGHIGQIIYSNKKGIMPKCRAKILTVYGFFHVKPPPPKSKSYYD